MSDFDPCVCDSCRKRPWQERAKRLARKALLSIPVLDLSGSSPP